ncbi:hypothetical protein SLA2020_210400 [Shorea laevis]
MDRVQARGAATRDDGNSRRRQAHRWRIARFDNRGFENTTVFFFYNFPETSSAKDLWHRFQNYGHVVDVYVPGRRDKWGKHFGFVRMTGVQSEKELERRFNDFWIGSYKVRVKVADDKRRSGIGAREGHRVGQERQLRSRMNRLVQPGHSYAQAVMGIHSQIEEYPTLDRTVGEMKVQFMQKEAVESCVKEDTSNRVVETIQDQIQEEVIDFTPMKEEVSWLEGSMVAVVRLVAMITSIQERIAVDGGVITVSLLGGQRVLLTEHDAGYMADYLQQNKELFDLWFESIKPWSLATQESSRLVWLRISGVPLKAWCNRCFERIGNLVGEVVSIHEDTTKRSILCDGRVLILCSEMSPVSRTVKLKVDEQLHSVGVTEEEWRSDPDFWLTDDDREAETETESEYSAMQNGNEDHDLILAKNEGEDEGVFNEEDLAEKEGGLNFKRHFVTESYETESSKTEADDEAECGGLTKANWPQLTTELECVRRVGPKEFVGPAARVSFGSSAGAHQIQTNAVVEEDTTSVQLLENRGL